MFHFPCIPLCQVYKNKENVQLTQSFCISAAPNWFYSHLKTRKIPRRSNARTAAAKQIPNVNDDVLNATTTTNCHNHNLSHTYSLALSQTSKRNTQSNKYKKTNNRKKRHRKLTIFGIFIDISPKYDPISLNNCL